MKSKDTIALFVTPYKPDVVGNGGNHRSYQLVYDLEALLGKHNVFIIYYYDWYLDWDKKLAFSKVSSTANRLNSDRKLTNWVSKLRDRVQLRTRLKRRWKRLRDVVQMRTRIRHTYKQFHTKIRMLVAGIFGLTFPQMKNFGTTNKKPSSNINDIVIDPTQEKLFASVYETQYSNNKFSRPEFMDYYRHMLSQIKPNIVIIDHSGMEDVIDHNRQHNIPTIICPQNLEALDITMLPEKSAWHMHARLYDLATEYAMFERCERRLFISKIEASFIQGLGCPSEFYPYRAVGQIYERMISIRREREQRQIEEGLYLLIGSAHYPPIADGLRWFVQEAAKHGLPDGIRVVVVGRATDELLPRDTLVPGLTLKGWTEQADLDDLMLKAHGILVPYRLGFGALTRLSELPYTGIPLIASDFATRGIESEIGIYSIPNKWEHWYDAMQQLKDNRLGIVPLVDPTGQSRPSALQIAIQELLCLDDVSPVQV